MTEYIINASASILFSVRVEEKGKHLFTVFFYPRKMCCLKMYFHVRLFRLLAFNVQGMLQMIYLRTCGKDILIWGR